MSWVSHVSLFGLALLLLSVFVSEIIDSKVISVKGELNNKALKNILRVCYFFSLFASFLIFVALIYMIVNTILEF